jgi:hypothetical protein
VVYSFSGLTETATTLHSISELYYRLKECESDVQVYSNPHSSLLLPYPYPGDPAFDRFQIKDNFYFTFMGREMFDFLSKEILALENPANYSHLHLYGTMGVGKSHILAAMTCFLLRHGRRVVYIPDCRKLMVAPVEYVQQALLLTFADQPDRQQAIAGIKTLEQLGRFCKTQGWRKELLYFIVDQYNAFDPETEDGIDTNRRDSVKADLGEMMFLHYAVISASANRRQARFMNRKQMSIRKIAVYDGLSKVNQPSPSLVSYHAGCVIP